MTGTGPAYVLLGILAIGLIAAIVTDIRARDIPNRLTAALALLAPLYWIAAGLDPWPDMGIRLGQGVAVFVVFAGFFALGAMGGGDVKLIAALACWFHWVAVIQMIFITSIAGGVLTLVMWIHHNRQATEKPLEIPYGIAIAIGGLWVIGERYFNQFT